MAKICLNCGEQWPDDITFCPKDGTALRPADTAEIVGQVIADRYRVLRKLGQGGMGAVYLAEHVRMGMKMALKVIIPEKATSADAVARFTREAKNAASIKHPNVCSVFDFGETSGGVVYLAMEYIEGRTLTDVLRDEGAIAPQRAADILRQCADALQAAHDMGIVHRDFKPDNVMLTRARDADVVKVVDFGIAKAASGMSPGGVSGQTVTGTGLVVGTPEFMSPEQAAGVDSDPRSDLYALALVLFRMLTGKMPFSGSTPQESLAKRLTELPLRLGDAVPGATFPPQLQAVLDRALARDREHRYATVLEFANDAASVLRAMAPVPGLNTGGETSLVPSHETEEERRGWMPAALRTMHWPARVVALSLPVAILVGVTVLLTRPDPPPIDTRKGVSDSAGRVGATMSGTSTAKGDSAGRRDSARGADTRRSSQQRDVRTMIPPSVQEQPAEIDATLRDRLTLLANGRGGYVAFYVKYSPRELSLWWGDSAKLFKQRLLGLSGSPGMGYELMFEDPRALAHRNGSRASPAINFAINWTDTSVVALGGGKFGLSCGDRREALELVPEGQARRLLSHARFYEPLWQRRDLALARDDNNRYFYVDGPYASGSTDLTPRNLRLFVGTKGNMKPAAISGAVSDAGGTVLSQGQRKLRLLPIPSQQPTGTGEWIDGGRATRLIVLDLRDHDAFDLVYGDLGVYKGERFGTPCDGL